MAAVELMVIEVDTSSNLIPANSLRMSDKRRDGHADPADFAGRKRMVGIETHLGREIESDRKTGGSLAEQIAVAAVAFLGGAESGVLPHGPEAAAIHVAVDAASVRETRRASRESA